MNLEKLLNDVLADLQKNDYIKVEDIPNIDLYMDQVTTFMDSKLKGVTRNPEEDKILTKTMINNYAKNDLIPPPVKKKYTKEHMIYLVFIYYFKNVLSIHDLQILLKPLDEYFKGEKADISLFDIYEEIFGGEKDVLSNLTQNVNTALERSSEAFGEAEDEEKEYLQFLYLISALGMDAFFKILLAEKLIDRYQQDHDKK